MALQARFKPKDWDTRSGRRERPSDVPFTFRVLCGYQNCRGMLAQLGCDAIMPSSSDVGYTHGNWIAVADGYVQVEPNVWRLGRHAAKQPRHQPRRPRYTPFSSAEAARRRRNGLVILPGGSSVYDVQVSRRVAPQTRLDCVFEPVALGSTIMIECGRCHALSQFVVRPSAEILDQEVKRRAHRPA